MKRRIAFACLLSLVKSVHSIDHKINIAEILGFKRKTEDNKYYYYYYTSGNFCGTSLSDATQCLNECPEGTDNECPFGQSCFFVETCDESEEKEEDEQEEEEEDKYEDEYQESDECLEGMTNIFELNDEIIYDSEVWASMWDIRLEPSPVISYNNDANALASFTMNCVSYNGRVVGANINYDGSAVDCGVDAIDFHNYPFCVANTCTDEEAEAYLNLDNSSDTCVRTFSITDEITGHDDLGKEILKVKKTKKSKSTSPKSAKSSKSSRHSEKAEILQCFIDMTKIHNNEFGINPLTNHDFLLTNLVDCADSVCVYNGNETGLEEYSNYCDVQGGKVVQSTWIFTDECEEDAGFGYDWINVPECVARSCNNASTLSFMNSVYFDPDDTECNADISITEESYRSYKTKSSKSTPSSRSAQSPKTKVIKKVKVPKSRRYHA